MGKQARILCVKYIILCSSQPLKIFAQKEKTQIAPAPRNVCLAVLYSGTGAPKFFFYYKPSSFQYMMMTILVVQSTVHTLHW